MMRSPGSKRCGWRTGILLVVLLLMTSVLLPQHGEGATITDAYPNNGDAVAGVTTFYMQDDGSATSAEIYIDGMFVAFMKVSLQLWAWESVVDTRAWGDGYHLVTYRSYGGTGGNDARSYSVLFDNSPPRIADARVDYGPGLSAASNLSKVRVLAHVEDDLGQVSTVRVDISGVNTSLPAPYYAAMYDDGLHGDSAPGDMLYGSDEVVVSAVSGVQGVVLSVMDTLGNEGSLVVPVNVDNHPPFIRKVEVVYPPGQTSARVGDEVRVLAEIDDTNFIYVTRTVPGPVDIALVLDNSDTLTLSEWLDVESSVIPFIDSLNDRSRVSIFASSISGSREDVRMLLPFTRLSDSAQDPIDGFRGTGRDVVEHVVTVDDGLHLTTANGTPGGFRPAWDLIGEAAIYVLNNFEVGSMPGVVVVVSGDDLGPGGDQSGSEVFVPGAYPSGGSKALSTWTTMPPSQGAVWGDPQTRVYDRVARLTGASPQVWRDVVVPDEPVRTGLLGIPVPVMGVSYLLPVQGVNPSLPGYISPSATQNGAPAYVAATAKAYDFTVDRDLEAISTSSPNGRHYYAENGGALAVDLMDIRNRLSMLTTRSVGVNTPHGIIEFGANLSALGYPYLLQMYDDGMHDDGFPGDGVFGTDLVRVGVSDTRKEVISVSARDIAGHVNSTPTLILIDNDPPRVEDVMSHYLTGKNSVRDGGVAYVSARVSDTGSVNGIVEVFLESSYVSPRVRMLDDGMGNDAAVNDGIYTSSNFTVPVGAPNGKNVVTVSGKDGSFQVTLGYGTLVVDNPPPTVRILDPVDGAYLNSSTAILVNVSDERYYSLPLYSIDGGPWTGMTPVSGKVWNYTGTIDITALPEGPHNASVRTIDSSGNVVTAPLNFTVDHDPPVVVPQVPVEGGYLSGNVTLRAWAWDSIGMLVLSFRVGTLPPVPMTYNALTGTYEGVLDTLLLPDGRYTAMLTAVDLARRVTVRTVNMTVDNTPPQVELVSPQGGGVVSGSVMLSVNVTDISPVNLTYTVGQMGERPISEVWNTTDLSDGGYTLRVRGRDMAGWSTLVSVLIMVDNTAPRVLPLEMPGEGEHVSGVVGVRAKVDDLSLEVTSLSLASVQSVLLLCSDYTPAFECRFDSRLHPDGNYTLLLRSQDRTGATTLLSRNVTIDNTAPLVVLSPRTTEVLTGDVEFSAHAEDISPGVSLWLSLDNGSWVEMGSDPRSGRYIQTWYTTTADNGKHLVLVRARDSLGNEKVYTYRYVVDNFQWGWVYFTLVLVLVGVIALLLRREVEIEEVIEEEEPPRVVVVQQAGPSPIPAHPARPERRRGVASALHRIISRRRARIPPPPVARTQRRGLRRRETPAPAGSGDRTHEDTPPSRLPAEERRRMLRQRAAARRERRR